MPFFYMIHILFFRSHQKIARSLKQQYPEYDDEKIYNHCKMINILIMIKSTLGLYGDVGLVQSSVPSTFTVNDLEGLMKSHFYRLFGPVNKLFPSQHSNIPIEFNILYRWHQFIPPQIQITDFETDTECEVLRLPYPNEVEVLTKKNGMETFLLSSMKTPVGKLTLNNTDKFLSNMAVLGGMKKTRFYRMQSFNEYRKKFGFKPYASIDEITDNQALRDKLNALYDGDVDKVEFYIGIFAEDKLGGSLHGPFLYVSVCFMHL